MGLAGKVLLILCLIWSIFHTSPLVYREETWVPLSRCSEEIPFATMQELLPDATVREDRAWPNDILHISTPLAQIWQLRQQLHITLPDGTETSGSLNITLRETAFPSVARNQARSAFSKGERQGQEPTSLSIDGIDFAFYYPYRAYDYVVLQKDNRFLSVDFHIYSGDPVTPEQIARAMAPYLTE